MGIAYTVNPTIVRGLDYYTKTVFEFVSTGIGAQGTVCGGGRYDGLVEEIGGPSMPSLGFGLGLERLMLVLAQPDSALAAVTPQPATCTWPLWVIRQGPGVPAGGAGADHLPERRVRPGGQEPESQMKYADKLGAKFSLVLGDSELEEQKAKVKNMATGEQKEISLGESFVDEFTQIYFDAQSSLSL